MPDPNSLFDDAPCGYAVLDADGVVLSANQQLLRMLGRSRSEVEGGHTFASFITMGGRIFYETHLLPMLLMETAVHEIALDLISRDGAHISVLVSANLAPGSSERDARVRVVIFEAQHRRRYESDLLDATRSAVQARAEATALAQTLQATLIPPTPPSVPGLDIAAAYRPAGDGSEVGGDFYDVFQVGEDAWVLVLGDVSGKGVAAAAVTAFVRHTVRALAMQVVDPAMLLQRLNAALLAHPTDRYCTIALLRVCCTPEGWRLSSAVGGHPLPLIRASSGAMSELGSHGSPVGLLNDVEFRTVEHLVIDETVTLYTDGVTEARREDDLFGDARLFELCSRLGPEPGPIVDGTVGMVLDFQNNNAGDDIALLAFCATKDRCQDEPAPRKGSAR